jgi:ubiquinone/menaquinone biosynthesis C-methylase UbiE
MLGVAQSRLDQLGYKNVQLAVGDHRSLPAEESSVDLIISGWSMCYVYVDGGAVWREALDQTIANFQRFLRPGGKIILIETLGTGNKQPLRIPTLADYLNRLDEIGFQLKAIRTDYRFENTAQARELSSFFFGEEIFDKLEDCILPECTGLWWQGKT